MGHMTAPPFAEGGGLVVDRSRRPDGSEGQQTAAAFASRPVNAGDSSLPRRNRLRHYGRVALGDRFGAVSPRRRARLV